MEKMVPNDQTLSPDAIDILNKCAAEFAAIIISEANEIAGRAGKTIVAPEHVLQALKDLEFDEYHDEVEKVAKEAVKKQVCHPIPTGECALVKDG
jgi:predicted ATP-dependent protease